MKNPNVSIGNRTSDLSAYSAVAQPTATPHSPNLRCKKDNIFPVHVMKAEKKSCTPEKKVLYPLYGTTAGLRVLEKNKSLLRLLGFQT